MFAIVILDIQQPQLPSSDTQTGIVFERSGRKPVIKFLCCPSVEGGWTMMTTSCSCTSIDGADNLNVFHIH